jgi:phosphoesterase RecJ-like protein
MPEIKPMENLESFKSLMQSPKKVSIIAHHNPDADALGSSLALSLYLQKKGHQVEVIMPSAFPSFLDWMPHSDSVISYTPAKDVLCSDILQNAEIIFFIDFSTESRTHQVEPLIQNLNAKKVIIDHHQNPTMEADFWLWDVKASSTAELIYCLIEMMDDKDLLDAEIGACIYAGIVTDTASFKHASTTKKVHLIAAELIDIGVNTSQVQRYIYDNHSENRLRFLGYALLNKLTILPQYRTAYFVLTKSELEEYENQLGDSEGLVDYALAVKGIVLAVVIIEKDDCIKMSFRSVGNFPVNLFAQKHFSGGGHKNAAGSDYVGSPQDTEKKLLDLLPLYQTQLDEADK